MDHRPRRRIVMFLDGTWNTDDGDTKPTNIVRLREALKVGVDRALEKQIEEGKNPKPDDKIASGSIVIQKNGSHVEYLVYYDRGVGTGLFFDVFSGGAFGTGLEQNIRQAYRFLSEHYAEGDEIFVFGFSRGAFTARSIVGYLVATGLLKAQYCTEELENRAWRHYRTTPLDRYCGEWAELQPFMFDQKKLSISCLGVFDTVGALGIPIPLFRKSNLLKYAFHDTELNSIVKCSLHAVAIDEHRQTFRAALWHRPKFKRYNDTVIEQVWFPGSHSDIGGGYSDWSQDGDNRSGRADIAFEWMLQRLKALMPELEFPLFEPEGEFSLRLASSSVKTSMIHRPWHPMDWIRRPAVRRINQIPSPKRFWSKQVGQIPHADPIFEAVHISALELLGKPIREQGRWRMRPYRPGNLIAALPAIVATYQDADPAVWKDWQPYARTFPNGRPAEPELCVVDWDGTWIHRSDPAHADRRKRLLDLIPKSPGRLGLTKAPAPTLPAGAGIDI